MFNYEKLSSGILLYAYGVLLGAAYIFSFWRPFGFQIFPYLSLQDYIVEPLNRVVVLVALPLILLIEFFDNEMVFGKGKVRYAYIYLMFLYAVGFTVQFICAVSSYYQFEFHYRNEINVCFISMFLFFISCSIAAKLYRGSTSIQLQIVSLILIQTAEVMSAGYTDGKSVFNGAVEVYFLGNKEMCEQNSSQNWVYLGKFSQQAIFIGTKDKRLCITNEIKFNLISRQYSEGL